MFIELKMHWYCEQAFSISNIMFQVQALYDFEAIPGYGELSLKSGEVLRISPIDVEEGWLAGTNARGESGVFPEEYVEVLHI